MIAWSSPLWPTTVVRDLVLQVVLASPSTVLSAAILRLNHGAFIRFPGKMGSDPRKESCRGLSSRRDTMQVPLLRQVKGKVCPTWINSLWTDRDQNKHLLKKFTEFVANLRITEERLMSKSHNVVLLAMASPFKCGNFIHWMNWKRLCFNFNESVWSWNNLPTHSCVSVVFLHCILHEGKLQIVNVKDSLGALQFQRHEANSYLSHYCHQIKVSPWMQELVTHRRRSYKWPMGGHRYHDLLNSYYKHVINKKWGRCCSSSFKKLVLTEKEVKGFFLFPSLSLSHLCRSYCMGVGRQCTPSGCLLLKSSVILLH